MSLLQRTAAGLYCPAGGFYIDPWEAVPRAVLTHLHGDHARAGCGQYLVAESGLHLARLRLGLDARIDTAAYGRAVTHNGVQVSLLPAGHIHGSAQIRLEHQGQVWGVSGDYKTQPDPTCQPLEIIRCHTFVTESTFGLPIYRWPATETVFTQIHQWWSANQEAGKTSVLYGYTLGKAQRLLAGLDPSIGPIFVHGAVLRVNNAYEQDGVKLPAARHANASVPKTEWPRSLIIAPPWAHGSPWLRRFGKFSAAMASGWMRIRGTRRRRTLDRGFVLSDHADWPGLLSVIEATGAETVWTTHGYASVMARHLQELGRNTLTIETRFRGELLDETEAADEEEIV